VSVNKVLFHNKPGRGETVLKNRAVLTLTVVVVFCGAVVFCGLLGVSGYSQGHIPATQFEIGTVPLGYFELTVSPAVVYANVGEPIEIRCSIDCLIDTVVEVSSVDVLLFDYYGSMIREQAMTRDSYWSAYAVYTIVGDEAYYQMKFDFSIRGDPSGEHSEYGDHRFPVVVNQESTQFRTGTAPLGYFELTVSPTGVCANVGEQIEIRCTIEPLINTPIEISSVDVVLFDSCDSILGEQAMTMDSHWSAHTVYTIVGDEAYYQLEVNFAFLTFPYAKQPGEYIEYTAHYFPIVVNEE